MRTLNIRTASAIFNRLISSSSVSYRAFSASKPLCHFTPRRGNSDQLHQTSQVGPSIQKSVPISASMATTAVSMTTEESKTDKRTPEKRPADAMEESTPAPKKGRYPVSKLGAGFVERQAQEVTFPIPGGSHIAAIAFGPPESEATRRVICVHGWLDNAASFNDLATQFDPSFRVVCIDLPGHGKSSHRPHGMPYFFPHYAMSVMQAADAMGWETFSLVGHSMGAGIAAICAGGWPKRVKHCVCIEGLGPLVYDASRAPEKLAQAYENWGKLVTRQAKLWPSVAQATERVRDTRKGLSHRAALLLLERGADIFEDGTLRFRHDQLLRAGSPMYLTKDQVDTYMSKIECPVLHFRANMGWPFPEGVFESWTELISSIRIERVEGGHHFHMDNPLTLGPTVNEFIKS